MIPLTAIVGDEVEFHQGGNDIDAAIFIPVSVLTSNSIFLGDTISINYFITDLDGGPDSLLSASDGIANSIMVPEPAGCICYLQLVYCYF